MKKTVSILLAIVCAIACAFTVSACGDNDDIEAGDVAGNYILTEYEGTLSQNGITVTFTDNVFNYFYISLNEDGTATTEVISAGSSESQIDNGTWSYNDGELILDIEDDEEESETDGLAFGSIRYEDDRIIMEMAGVMDGASISMRLVFDRVTADDTVAKVAGTYEMTDISGVIVSNGVTIQINKSFYEYYRIILNADGSAKVESKASNSSQKYSSNATWSFEGGKIKLVSTQGGISVTEVMDYEDGVITYTANQSAQGMSVSMTIILEKA